MPARCPIAISIAGSTEPAKPAGAKRAGLYESGELFEGWRCSLGTTVRKFLWHKKPLILMVETARGRFNVVAFAVSGLCVNTKQAELEPQTRRGVNSE